jgi:hypothetical protein
MNGRRDITEPETRVGNCCGCQQLALLFKIPGIFRYRCATCFEKETGYRHHLTPAAAVPA